MQKVCLPSRRCPILIVAPTSVLTNWQREFNTWGAFHVALCHGKQDVRTAMLQGVQNGQFEVLITSYDTFRYPSTSDAKAHSNEVHRVLTPLHHVLRMLCIVWSCRGLPLPKHTLLF